MGGRGQTISYICIPNPYDAYPDDHSKNWLRARSKLVIKDRVAVIVFNNKEAEKLAADIVGGGVRKIGGNPRTQGCRNKRTNGSKVQF
jgi:hypothetical protein